MNSVAELKEALLNKELKVVELVEKLLTDIEDKDKELNCFLTVDKEGALRQAQQADKDISEGNVKVLTGVPVAVKDNIVTKGVRTTCASKILDGWTPPYDATVVSALKKQGAVIIGKTNMDEFAMGSSTEYSSFYPTKNPLDVTCVPGGSSGGSAAAVASGLSMVALGSDTGGSIRQPAAFCSVVGIKPTYGLVSRFGLVAFGSSLDQIGTFGKNVKDAALLLDVISGHDPNDSTSIAINSTNLFRNLKPEIKGLKVGVIKEFYEQANHEIKQSFEKLISCLSDNGCQVSHISMPSLKYALPAYYLIAPAEASSNLARFDGVRYGLRVDGSTAKEMMIKTRSAGFGPEVKRRIMLGTYVLSHGYYDAYYLKALKVRTLVKKEFDTGYEKFDLLISPTTPTLPFKLGEKISDPISMYLSDLFTIPTNLAGHPAVSVPFGDKIGNFKAGIQIMARPLDEQKMLNLAEFVQEADG